MNRAEPRPVDYTVLILAQFAVGSAAILARAGLDAGIDPIALTAWRLTLASAILLPILRIRRGSRTQLESAERTRASWLWLVLAGACLAVHFAAWFASLNYLSVARSTLLVCTSPLFAGIAGRFLLGHRLGWTFWLGLAIAAVGVYLITGAQGAAYGGATLRGDLLALLGAAAIAGYLLIAEVQQRHLTSMELVARTYPLAALCTWPICLAAAPVAAIIPSSGPAWFSVISMALVPQLIGHTAMNWSLRRFPSGVVGAATLLEPAIAAGLAWWLLAEPITGIQASGGVVLLVGVGLALKRR